MGLVNILRTNFESGVNNRKPDNLFGSMKQLDPTRFHTYMEDFERYLAAEWAVGGAGAGTEVLTDEDGGVLRIATASVADNAETVRKVGENVVFESGERIYFRARLRTDDATLAYLNTGLVDQAGSAFTPNDGIIFVKPAGGTSLNLEVYEGSSVIASVNGIADISTDVFLTVEFMFDGDGELFYGVDNTELGSLDVSSLTLPGPSLTESMVVQTSTGVTRTGDWDYLMLVKERG